MPAVSARRRPRARASRLAWPTVLCNLAEGVVPVAAGSAVGAVALVSSGLDSGWRIVGSTWKETGATGVGRGLQRSSSVLALCVLDWSDPPKTGGSMWSG